MSSLLSKKFGWQGKGKCGGRFWWRIIKCYVVNVPSSEHKLVKTKRNLVKTKCTHGVVWTVSSHVCLMSIWRKNCLCLSGWCSRHCKASDTGASELTKFSVMNKCKTHIFLLWGLLFVWDICAQSNLYEVHGATLFNFSLGDSNKMLNNCEISMLSTSICLDSLSS